MGSVSVCAEQYRHKFFLSHQPNRTHNLHIPPRKLLQVSDASPAGEESSSPMQKFLPYNDGEEESDGGDESDNFDPYSADYFRMYEFKVRRCTRSRSHDWTDCPFAHPGEKARRRDPRRYSYSGTICSEFRRGGCNRGDSCEFSHGVFETWLHPSRYRTEACKDGRNCKRKVCFFAHTPRQLRILPPQSCESEKKEGDLVNGGDLYGSNHCCRHCRCHSTRSPTSTLMNVSRLSSPISPSSPPISRTMMGYKNVMSELVGPLEAINISVDSPRNPRSFASWLDFPSFNGGEEQLQQQQFVLSPSPPSNSGSKEMDSSIVDEKLGGSNNGGLACPDLEWVNELLM